MEEKRKRKKRNRRNSSQYPALEKKFTLKSRLEFLDVDYINGVFDKNGNKVIRGLNEEEKEWLNKFYKETLNASFGHEDPLIDTQEGRKSCYDANNQRNRDIYNKKKSMNMLTEIDDETFYYAHTNLVNFRREIEEDLDRAIDEKIKREIEEKAQAEWEERNK